MSASMKDSADGEMFYAGHSPLNEEDLEYRDMVNEQLQIKTRKKNHKKSIYE